jgi:hypothetical protein
MCELGACAGKGRKGMFFNGFGHFCSCMSGYGGVIDGLSRVMKLGGSMDGIMGWVDTI